MDNYVFVNNVKINSQSDNKKSLFISNEILMIIKVQFNIKGV